MKKEKWTAIFRANLEEADINADQYSDEEICAISKGMMAPMIADNAGIERDWVFELFWEALLTMDPSEVLVTDSSESMVNMEKFKQMVKRNQN